MSDDSIYDTKYIRESIELILKDLESFDNSLTTPDIYINSKYSDFYNKYPCIVKKLCKGDNIDYLYKMLDALEDVNNNIASFKSVESKLANELANKYLYPNIK